MPQIKPRDFSFEDSIYSSGIGSKPAKLPSVSYLSPARVFDETTLGKLFPKLDINKSIASSLMPKVRGDSKVFSPFVYRKTLGSALQKFEAMDADDFRNIVDVLKREKSNQELFLFYQNALFAA